jgi:hypothetical protein
MQISGADNPRFLSTGILACLQEIPDWDEANPARENQALLSCLYVPALARLSLAAISTIEDKERRIRLAEHYTEVIRIMLKAGYLLPSHPYCAQEILKAYYNLSLQYATVLDADAFRQKISPLVCEAQEYFGAERGLVSMLRFFEIASGKDLTTQLQFIESAESDTSVDPLIRLDIYAFKLFVLRGMGNSMEFAEMSKMRAGCVEKAAQIASKFAFIS